MVGACAAHTQHSPPELSSGWPCGTGKHPDVTAIFEKGCSKHPDATIGTIAHTVEAQSAVSLLRTHEALAETDLAAAVAGAGSRVDATAAKYNTLMAMPSKTKSHQGPRKLHLWQLRPGGQHGNVLKENPELKWLNLCIQHFLNDHDDTSPQRDLPSLKTTTIKLWWGIKLFEDTASDPRVRAAQELRCNILSRPQRKCFVACTAPNKEGLYYAQGLLPFTMVYGNVKYELLFVRYLSDTNPTRLDNASPDEVKAAARDPTATRYTWSEAPAVAGAIGRMAGAGNPTLAFYDVVPISRFGLIKGPGHSAPWKRSPLAANAIVVHHRPHLLPGLRHYLDCKSRREEIKYFYNNVDAALLAS